MVSPELPQVGIPRAVGVLSQSFRAGKPYRGRCLRMVLLGIHWRPMRQGRGDVEFRETVCASVKTRPSR